MKKLLTLAALVGATTVTFAQGTVNFVNSGGAAMLISAGGVSTPSSAVSQFNFAVFLAPSTTATGSGQTASFTSPAFQTVGAYNVNGTALGRVVNLTALDVGTSQSLGAGSTVDFIVRGWSANAGATWAQALAFWNNGAPSADMYIGTSTIGNDILLGGGAIGNTQLFGLGANQVTGFNLGLVSAVVVPEPSSLVLAGLGAASLLAFRRRN